MPDDDETRAALYRAQEQHWNDLAMQRYHARHGDPAAAAANYAAAEALLPSPNWDPAATMPYPKQLGNEPGGNREVDIPMPSGQDRP